jgi:hypothetical protein
MEKVKFSRHALNRARQRHFWKFVSKEKFYFDATYVAPGKARLAHCLYVYKESDKEIIILTMYNALT